MLFLKLVTKIVVHLYSQTYNVHINVVIIINFSLDYLFVLSPSDITCIDKYCVFVACRQVFDNCENCRFLNENDTDSLTCTDCEPGYFFNYYGNCSGKLIITKDSHVGLKSFYLI